MLSYFNLENEISSPTFTIVNEYKTEKMNIFHFDVYRLHSVEEFYDIGGTDYFGQGLCIIEWGEIIKDVLPSNYIQISFKRNLDEENKRIITIEPIGQKYINLIKNLSERKII